MPLVYTQIKGLSVWQKVCHFLVRVKRLIDQDYYYLTTCNHRLYVYDVIYYRLILYRYSVRNGGLRFVDCRFWLYWNCFRTLIKMGKLINTVWHSHLRFSKCTANSYMYIYHFYQDLIFWFKIQYLSWMIFWAKWQTLPKIGIVIQCTVLMSHIKLRGIVFLRYFVLYFSKPVRRLSYEQPTNLK